MTLGEGDRPNADVLQGTLDMLILKALSLGAMHGWGIAQRIQQVSEEVLQVNQGSLYPALHRLERKGWVGAEWGTSENNRRAKYYRLTSAGERQLGVEEAQWRRFAGAVERMLAAAGGAS
jgi:PadR family transcriptional regulator PadR